MKRDGRWDAQRNLADRIARITTRILHPGEGVALRFMNQDVDNSSNLTFEQIENIIGSVKCGFLLSSLSHLSSSPATPTIHSSIKITST